MTTDHKTHSQGYSTDEYFGLADSWLETAPGELTHFHELGTGTPVTFLHGSGAGVSAAANWWLNLPAIAEGFRTIAPDLVGFGQTVPGPERQYGIDAWAQHTVRLLDALELDKTWLVGNSLGGWVAFQLAIDYPERVHGVVSMGTGGARRTTALKRHGAPDVSFTGIQRVLREFVTDPSLISDELVQARLNAAEAEAAQARFAEVIRARDHDRERHPLDTAVLAEFDRPVLLIHGREDSVIPVSRSWDLAHVLPNADLHLFANCGHWSQIEHAEKFNALVTQFLNMHGPANKEPDYGTQQR